MLNTKKKIVTFSVTSSMCLWATTNHSVRSIDHIVSYNYPPKGRWIVHSYPPKGREIVVNIYRGIQLFRERLSEKCASDNPERKCGICAIHCSQHCSCRTYFCCFSLALTDICPWPLEPLFQILWQTVNSKPPAIPFGVVACTLSDNRSQNSCISSAVHRPRGGQLF